MFRCILRTESFRTPELFRGAPSLLPQLSSDFSTTTPMQRQQGLRLKPKKRTRKAPSVRAAYRTGKIYGKDAFGYSSHRIYDPPHPNDGLTQDQIVQKALAFYRFNVNNSNPCYPDLITQSRKNIQLPPLPPSLPSAKIPDGSINPEFYNRNPRNMELMNLELKTEGWDLEKQTREYYNRLYFSMDKGHTKGYVEHCSGRIVVSASTEEFAIAKHLYRYTDVSAAHNIGRILARRMLETGLIFVYCPYDVNDKKSEKMSAFLTAMINSGIQLQEGKRIKEPNPYGSNETLRLKGSKPQAKNKLP